MAARRGEVALLAVEEIVSFAGVSAGVGKAEEPGINRARKELEDSCRRFDFRMFLSGPKLLHFLNCLELLMFLGNSATIPLSILD